MIPLRHDNASYTLDWLHSVSVLLMSMDNSVRCKHPQQPTSKQYISMQLILYWDAGLWWEGELS